jgi:putative molybdopterin biosynthesis protein
MDLLRGDELPVEVLWPGGMEARLEHDPRYAVAPLHPDPDVVPIPIDGSGRVVAQGIGSLHRHRVVHAVPGQGCLHRLERVAGDQGPIAFPTPKGSGSVTAFSQADGLLAIDALASSLDAGSRADVTLIGTSRMPDLVITGSHCVALDVVLGRLADQGLAARTIVVGSQGGVTAAERGECDLAPVHLLDPSGTTYNRHLLRPGLALVPGWRRMQGVVFRAGDARFAGKTAEQAIATALADPSCLMVNRNDGAGTRVLIDKLVAAARPPGYANQPRSHNAVAAAIAQARADWGIAIEPVAKMYELGFLPLSPEHYDFLLIESRRGRPAVQAFLAALRDRRTKDRIAALGMQPADD